MVYAAGIGTDIVKAFLPGSAPGAVCARIALGFVLTDELSIARRPVQTEPGLAIEHVEHVEPAGSFTTRSNVSDCGRMILEGPTDEVLASDVVRAANLGDLEPTP